MAFLVLVAGFTFGDYLLDTLMREQFSNVAPWNMPNCFQLLFFLQQHLNLVLSHEYPYKLRKESRATACLPDIRQATQCKRHSFLMLNGCRFV